MNFYEEVAKNMLKALETGQLAALKACYTEDAVQTEWPNNLNPQGGTRNMSDVFQHFEEARKVLKFNTYDIQTMFAQGEKLVVEFIWTGSFHQDIGQIKAGEILKANCAAILEFKEGRIHRQRNYDCFYKGS